MTPTPHAPRRTAARVSPSTELLEGGPPPSAIGTLVGIEEEGAPAPAAPKIAEGEQLGGRYALLEQIGRGATGRIWRARHTTIGREFAIKVLTKRPDTSDDDDLLREARALSKVTHPNVVSVSDFGFAQPGQPYAVMELLDGRPLRAVIEDGPLSWEQARPWIEHLLEGLAAAHAADVVHGDITPNNLFIQHKQDRLKLIDFGLARSTCDRQREVTGTPAYMSPEQIRHDPLDARSDLYSMGCVVFEMLTGKPPFSGSTHNLLTQHLESRPPRKAFARDVPRKFAQAIEACLAKNRDARPENALEVLDALRAAPAPSRRPWFGVAAALVVAGGLSWGVAEPSAPAAFATRSFQLPLPQVQATMPPELQAELPVVEIAKQIVLPEAEVSTQPAHETMPPPPRRRRARKRRAAPQQVKLSSTQGDDIPTFTPGPASATTPDFGPVDGLKNPFSTDPAINATYSEDTPTGP